MGRPRRETCRSCGEHETEVGPLSRRGLCAECGIGNAVAAARQLAAHDGPYFDRWRERTGLAVGARIDRKAG